MQVHGVDCILVGGMSAMLHGSTVRTVDSDFVPRWTRDNLDRLCSALNSVDAAIMIRSAVDGDADTEVYRRFPGGLEYDDVRNLGSFRVRTSDGDRIDILQTIPLEAGDAGHRARYDELAPSATPTEVADDVVVQVIGRDHLIASKRAAGRPHDLTVVRELIGDDASPPGGTAGQLWQARPMSDWDGFLGEVGRFVRPGAAVTVGEPTPWDRDAVPGLPVLSALLADATLTPVTVADQPHELLAWGPAGDRRGWLCLPPVAEPPPGLDPVHRAVLAVCGGIVERFGEPDSWWLNQDEVLTVAVAATDVAEVLDASSWLWEDEGLEVPISAADVSVVAVEANGNLTLVERETSRLLLFAPDHAFDGVTPLPGSPEYSLLTIDAAPDLRSWIELAATAWSEPR